MPIDIYNAKRDGLSFSSGFIWQSREKNMDFGIILITFYDVK